MLKLGPAEGDNVVAMEGLAAGELVVTVGGDKLREGIKVELIAPGNKGAAVNDEKTNTGTGQKKRSPSAPK